MTLSQAVAFVQDVEAHTGECPVLYSGNAAKEALGATPNPTLARCRLWLAHYANAPVCPPGWSEPWLWQWSDKGTTPGIVGHVDQDAYQGSPDDLRSEWTGGSARPDRPAPPTPEFDTITISVPAGSKVLIHTTGYVTNVVATE
jgi:GH25 family lysozyme M1 (1,4-beta-N-acetylmuramidase)